MAPKWQPGKLIRTRLAEESGKLMLVEDQIRKRLVRLADICLSFPGSTREDESRHSTFRVGKKIFAYYLNDHDRDQIISVCCRVLEGDNLRLLQSNPRKFYLPPYIGARGWVGFRLDLPALDWTEVNNLVSGSFTQTAPKKFLKLLRDSRPTAGKIS